MARKKTFTNEKGEIQFIRKIPEVGLRYIEKLTRPKKQTTPSQINEAGIERNLIAP